MDNEDDISAKEKTEIKSSWLQSKNEHTGRKKSFSFQKGKRKKSIISLGRIYVAFSSMLKKRLSMKFSESLKKNKDFQVVYKKGKSYADKYLVMYILKNDMDRNRIGISVSKKVGNSVVRHHLTRLLRESYRLQEEHFLCGYDIVIVVRVSAKNSTFADMKSALIHLGKLHKIYKVCADAQECHPGFVEKGDI